MGLEPPRSPEHRHLKPACCQFHHARSVPIVSLQSDMNLSVRRTTLKYRRGKGQGLRSAEQFETVRRLMAAGLNDCEIARRTRHSANDGTGLESSNPRSLNDPRACSCGVDHDFENLPAAAYSYVLGMYLGDGLFPGAASLAPPDHP